TAVGRKPLVALPRTLSAPAPLSRTGTAFHKSFRPTASRTCGTNTETPKPNQTQIPCACRSPLEKTLEADISIWRKTGHFYFALTLSFVALTVGPGSMDSRAKVNRTLGLVVLLVGSILPGRAQLSKNEPASVSQIQDEIKQHPDSPKLYVALGLAYWDRNDFSDALEAF